MTYRTSTAAGHGTAAAPTRLHAASSSLHLHEHVARALARVPVLSRALVDRISSQGWLESIWTGVVLAAVTLLLLAALVRLVRRRRRSGVLRRPRRTAIAATGTVALIGLVLTGAAFANTYAGYVPDLQAADRILGVAAPSAAQPAGLGTGAATGTVTRQTLADPANRIPAGDVWVYTPPGYDAPGNNARYPVVYLLHGWPGRPSDWFAAGRADRTLDLLIAQHDLPPVIAVAPDMSGGNYLQDTEGMNLPGGPQVENFLTGTVVRWTDAHYRTLADPAHRVIGGASAGGSVSLDLGLRHQKVFGGIVSEEPYGSPGTDTLAELHQNRAEYLAHSPDHYLPTLRFSRPMPTFISVGALANQNDARMLAAQLTGRGQPVQLTVEPGQRHTWSEARLGLAYGLTWVSAQLGWSQPATHPA
jgi:enterochelin esterase-like enzyme